jgi:ABC-type branched-subunit amino acid transport system ATPase component
MPADVRRGGRVHVRYVRDELLIDVVQLADAFVGGIDQRPVTLALEDRLRHLYIVGKTGMGKTTLIQNMITEDIAAGRGVCLVDPHGDLAESIAGLPPNHRTNDVILLVWWRACR